MGTFWIRRGRTRGVTGDARFAVLMVVFALVAVACDRGSADGAAPGAGSGTCDDRAGDVAATRHKGEIPDHADLRAIEVSREDDELVLRYDLGAAPPSDRKDRDNFPFIGVSFTALVDGRPRYSVGAPLYDSRLNAWEYAKDAKPGSEIEALDTSSGTVDVEGSQVTISLPLSVIPALEDEFSWFASAGASRTRTADLGRGARLADFCPNLRRSAQAKLGAVDTKVPQDLLDKLPTQP